MARHVMRLKVNSQGKANPKDRAKEMMTSSLAHPLLSEASNAVQRV